jgi:dinuclear metal center YbgI/SA1388 family protein
LDERFPFENAAAWDPVGLQLGAFGDDAGMVAVCHEVSEDVVEWSLTNGVNTLVSYHPLLFDPITAVVDGPTPAGRALRLLRSGLSLIVVHTAMDVASGGTADALLEVLGVATIGSFADPSEESGFWIGRYGKLAHATTAVSFSSTVSDRLSTPVQFAGDSEQQVQTVAVIPGSGSAYIAEAAAVADVLVTGDVGHHRAQDALQRGFVVVDAGHIPTERPGVEYLYASVRDAAPDALFVAGDPHPWEDVSWKT